MIFYMNAFIKDGHIMKCNKLNKQCAILVLASLTLVPEYVVAEEANATATENKVDASYPIDHEYTFGEVVTQSMFGDATLIYRDIQSGDIGAKDSGVIAQCNLRR